MIRGVTRGGSIWGKRMPEIMSLCVNIPIYKKGRFKMCTMCVCANINVYVCMSMCICELDSEML